MGSIAPPYYGSLGIEWEISMRAPRQEFAFRLVMGRRSRKAKEKNIILAWNIETWLWGVLLEGGWDLFLSLPTFYLSFVKYFSSHLEEIVVSFSGKIIYIPDNH